LESKRPSSWKQPTITRSKDEALEIINKLRDEIMATPDPQAKFAQLAAIHSDCSSYKREGDLGMFSRGMMQKPFASAAFALEVGHISSPVFSDSGVHIILRLE